MRLIVRRSHGLGNLLMLLPVLIKAAQLGNDVTLVTRPEWAEEMERWCPGVKCTADDTGVTHELDRITRTLLPRKHRTLEFAEALAIPGPFPALGQTRPSYHGPLARRFRGSIVYAPEAGHEARRWPIGHSRELAQRLLGSPSVLIGIDGSTKYPADEDLRGRLSLRELFDVVSAAQCVISMDSGILHVAMALGVPVIAIFGGIDPAYRILPMQRARVLVGTTPCRPCNKMESCNGEYACVGGIQVSDVLNALLEIPPIEELAVETEI